MAQQKYNPSKKFFESISSILNDPELDDKLNDSDAYLDCGYFCWPVFPKDSEIIYFYAANPNLQELYELDFAGQNPTDGIPIYSDEDFIWLQEELNQFIKSLDVPKVLTINLTFIFPAEARYVPGAIPGSIYIHSLS